MGKRVYVVRLVDASRNEVGRRRVPHLYPFLWDCQTGSYYDRKPRTKTYCGRYWNGYNYEKTNLRRTLAK